MKPEKGDTEADENKGEKGQDDGTKTLSEGEGKATVSKPDYPERYTVNDYEGEIK